MADMTIHSNFTDSDDGRMVRTPRRAENALFFVLWLFIIFVSVVDAYLVVQNRTHLEELNPQGQVLIALNGGKVWFLVAAKFLGTVIACTILLLIHRHSAKIGTTITAVLACLQFWLLLFLTFG